MPKTPQPTNSQVYRQSLTDAREAWAQKSGLTQAQVKGAYQQAATSLGARVAAAPPTAPSTAWNLSQLQGIMNDYASTLDQRVLDAMHAGVSASFHDAADGVLKAKVADAYGSVFGPEAIDAHVRGINQRAAATYMTRTGQDGIRLSDRVWKANQQWRGAVQSVVQDAVISGRPPVQVARQIEQYLQPGVNVPYKEDTAKRLRVPKDTSMPAMRVARTEMQNSFHEGTILSHGSMPSYLGIRWHIAPGPGHVPDVCDTYAAQGFFPKGTEPAKPHPHCFCTALPVHRELDDVLNDLDEWLANPGSHPELEDYYKNELRPILDVEIASVAGAAGGPLQGGYTKGDKVLIDVKGQQVIATINGETVSKGVLTMFIDPGQGMASIKVWRSPSKVKPYTGPPTQNVPLAPVQVPLDQQINLAVQAFKAKGVNVKLEGTVSNDQATLDVLHQLELAYAEYDKLGVKIGTPINDPITGKLYLFGTEVELRNTWEPSTAGTTDYANALQGKISINMAARKDVLDDMAVNLMPDGVIPMWAAQTSTTTISEHLLLVHEMAHILAHGLSAAERAHLEQLWNDAQAFDFPSLYGQEKWDEMFAEGVVSLIKGDQSAWTQWVSGTLHGPIKGDFDAFIATSKASSTFMPPVAVGDTVTITDGPDKGMQGTVESIGTGQSGDFVAKVKLPDGNTWEEQFAWLQEVVPIPALGGLGPGVIVHATQGQHLGKVGTVDGVNTQAGTVHVTWVDGTANNVVLSNLAEAPPAPPLLAGDMVLINAPESPGVNGLIGNVTKVNADGSLHIEVNVQGQAMAFDMPLVETFKLELQQTPPPPVPLGPTQKGDFVKLTDLTDPDFGAVVEVLHVYHNGSIEVKMPGGWNQDYDVIDFAKVAPPGTPLVPPTPAPQPPPQTSIGYLNYPGSSHHGKQIAKQVDPYTVQFMDGTFGHGFSAADVSTTDPLAAPPPPPPPPIAPPPTLPYAVGDKVQISNPGTVNDGAQGTVEQIGSTNGIVQILLADGSFVHLTSNQAQAQLKPLVATPATTARLPAKVDDLTLGDQVKILDSNHALYLQTVYLNETPAWYSSTQEVPVYLTQADALAGTNADFVKKTFLTVVFGTLKHSEPPLHQLVAGDQVLIKPNKGVKSGEVGTLQNDTLNHPADAVVSVLFGDGTAADYYIDDLLKPGPSQVVPSKPIEDYKVGEKLEVNLPGSPWHGKLVTLQDDYDAYGYMVAVDAQGMTKTFISGELVLPPSAFAPKIANAWDHLAAGDKVIVNLPSSVHHGEEVTLNNSLAGKGATDLITVYLADGTLWSYEVGQIAPKPGMPAQPAAGVAPYQGTAAQVNVPNDSMHGEQVVILESKPGASPTTPMKVKYTTGPNAGQEDWWPLSALVTAGTPITPAPATQPVVLHPPPGAVKVDVTVKGTKIVTDYQGQRNVTGVITSWNPGKNVVTIKPDIPIVGAKKATFTKNPKYVKAIVDPNAAQTLVPPNTQSTQQTQTPPPPKGVNHLNIGDDVVVNMPGSGDHGETATLSESLAGKAPDYEVLVFVATGPNAGMAKYVFVADLVAPGDPISGITAAGVAPLTPADFSVGDSVLDISGKQATVIAVGPDYVEVKQLNQIGSAVYDTPYLINKLVKPTQPVPPPGPPPAAPGAFAVGDAITITTSDPFYQGKTGTVVGHSANGNLQLQLSDGSIALMHPTAVVHTPLVTPSPAPLTPTVAPPPGAAQAPVMPTHVPPDPPKPFVGGMTVKPQVVKGGHAKTIYADAYGDTWMFKPDINAAQAEKAGYNVMKVLGLKTPEMHVMDVGGASGSMQKFHDDIVGEVALNSLPSLSAAQRGEIQAHQVVDWLISQHDSNDGAMLIDAAGHIVTVDKGQAFKFLMTPGEKLHWTYKPNPNQLVYQPLFEGYIGGRFDLDRAAVDDIITKIEALDDDVFKEALKPYADHAVQMGWVASPEVIYDKLIKRKHTIRKDFDKLYDEADAKAGRSSGPSLQGKPVKKAAKRAPTATAATSTGATSNQVTPIAQPLVEGIRRAGTHGKSILVGGKDIENGVVHTYTIRMPDGSTKLVLSTKVRSDAEKKLTNHLDGLPAPGTYTPAPSYTPPAPLDAGWQATLKGLKHFGYHMKAGGDQTISSTNTAEVIALAKQIKAGSLGWTAHKSQYYADILVKVTGAADINDLTLMTADALAQQVQTLWAGNTALLATQFTEYVAPVQAAPVAAAAPAVPAAPPGKFKARQDTPTYLRRKLVDGELVSDGTRTQEKRDGIVGHHEWFVDDLGPGMSMQYLPHFGSAHSYQSTTENPYARHGRLDITIDNWQGTPQEIEHALSKLKDLGLDADPATPQDVELLYLIHQVHAMKREESNDYQVMRAGINDSTPISDQIQMHKDFVSREMGVADVSKLPQYKPVAKFGRGYRPVGTNGHEMVDEVGRPTFERIDITAAQLKREMKKYVLTHDSTLGTEKFLDVLLSGNGHMANTEERVRQALFDPSQGMSSVDDMFSGGASYFFTRLANTARANEGQRGAFHFDIELMLQTDALGYDKDSFGQSDPTQKRKRNTTIDSWKNSQRVRSDNEFIIKDGFAALDYLVSVAAYSQQQRLRFIQMFKDRGISHIRGVPVEDVVVVR